MESGNLKTAEVPAIFWALDFGTGGLTGQVRSESGELLAEAKAGYGYGPDNVIAEMPPGVMLQDPKRWEEALCQVAGDLNQQLKEKCIVCQASRTFIGLAGQMHGLVMLDDQGEILEPAILWCDDRDANGARSITSELGVKVPQRFTASRFWGVINRDPNIIAKCARITTPAGWIYYRLTGSHVVGMGEASGMFPINEQGTGFDAMKIMAFEAMHPKQEVKIGELLPKPVRAGEFVDALSVYGSGLLGLSFGTKVAPPEGDQQAALVGSLIGQPGDAAISLGTSYVLNCLAQSALNDVFEAIDPFKTPDGKDFLMIWIKNGATFLDMVMECFRDIRGDADVGQTFAALMPLVETWAKEHPNCDGLLGLPYLISEPGAGFDQGGFPLLAGMNFGNFSKENLIHLATLLPLFGIKNGLNGLNSQGIAPQRLILTGGVTQSADYIGQTIADVCDRKVFIPEVATEGTTYGAYVLALFAYRRLTDPELSLPDLLADLSANVKGTVFFPSVNRVDVYRQMFQDFCEFRDNIWSAIFDY